jgi:CSLREA domain-containing protein
MRMRLMFRFIISAIILSALCLAGSVTGAPVRASGNLLIVNTNQDLTTCKPPGDGVLSLHCAIADANSDGTGDTIEFQISRTATTITLSSALPTLAATNTTIDGFTGNTEGSTANTNKLANGDNAVVNVTINGSNLQSGSDGLVIANSNDTVSGLRWTGFNFGITLIGPIFTGGSYTGDKVQGNFVGNTANLVTDDGNTDGVVVLGANDNALIGGTSPGDANVISGNSTNGVWSLEAQGTTIESNYIGTTASGASTAPNGSGVDIEGDSGADAIGGQYAGNVISGNDANGIQIDPTTDNPPVVSTGGFIQGNIIGSSANQSTALANLTGGITLNQATHYTVGGPSSDLGNYIIGNQGPGLTIIGGSNNAVHGNFIGYTGGGDAMGNAGDGVYVIESSVGDSIGSPTLNADANVIANNQGYGVALGDNLSDPVHVSVDRNEMSSNSYGGINLNGQDPVFCTAGFAYAENNTVNDLTPCPLILAATPDKIVGEACTGCQVEVYIANAGDDEGRLLLGTVTAGSCPATGPCTNFSPWMLPASAYVQLIAQGLYITATATSTVEPFYLKAGGYSNQTSSFSRIVPVGETINVNTTSDAASSCPSSSCSLRAALVLANSDGAGDEIDFNIPSGQCSPTCDIHPASALPTLTASSTFINAYSQSGASPNTHTTLGPGDNAGIRVHLIGDKFSGGNGFTFQGSYDSAEGLAVAQFGGDGFQIGGTGSGYALFDIVAGDFIGTLDGTTRTGNVNGVDIESRSAYTTVGGRAIQDDNIIGGNRDFGVLSSGPGGNTLRENLIGMNATDKGPLSNNYDGVLMFGTTLDIIGGIRETMVGSNLVDNEGNVISASFNNGVEGLDANESSIMGNEIGVDGSSDPGVKVGNGFAGVFLYLGSNNLVGDLPFGIGGNVIAGNAADGVDVLADSGDLVAGNVIGYVQANGGRGVMAGASTYVTGLSQRMARHSAMHRLGLSIKHIRHMATVGGETPIEDGVYSNVISGNAAQGVLVGQSTTDADVHVGIVSNSIYKNDIGIHFFGPGICSTSSAGVNDAIDCPFFTSAGTGSVSGSACDGCSVQVFAANTTKADQGYGEGALLLGSTSANTSGQWTLNFGNHPIANGTSLTATASQYLPYQEFGGYYLETSQFSQVATARASVVRHASPRSTKVPALHQRVQWSALKQMFNHASRAWPHQHVHFRPLKP